MRIWSEVPWQTTRSLYFAMTHGLPGQVDLVIDESGFQSTFLGSGGALGTAVRNRPSLVNLLKPQEQATSSPGSLAKPKPLPQIVLLVCMAGAKDEAGVTSGQEAADAAGLEVWAATTSVSVFTPEQARNEGASLGLDYDVETQEYGEWQLFRPTSWKREAHPEYRGFWKGFKALAGQLKTGPEDSFRSAVAQWEKLKSQVESVLDRPQDYVLESDDTGLSPATQPALRRTRDLGKWAAGKADQAYEELRELTENVTATGTSLESPEGLLADMKAFTERVVDDLIPAWDEQLGDSLLDRMTSSDLEKFTEELPQGDGTSTFSGDSVKSCPLRGSVKSCPLRDSRNSRHLLPGS